MQTVSVPVAVVVAVGLFGMLIGSFLNVVIYRVPAGKSVVSPPSACGQCGHAIRGFDNIPLVSWLVLKGKCRDCSARISARYPLVELGTGGFFALVASWVLFDGIRPGAVPIVSTILAGVAYLYFAAICISLSLIDLETHRLPNAIVLPSYLVGAVLLAAASITSGNYSALLTAAIGGAALFTAYLMMALLYPGGMGFGDVKLAGVIGLFLGWLGWGSLAVAATAAFVLGGLYAIILLLARRATGKTGVPFGPWMIAGAWVGILAGPQIAAGYLSLFGLGES
jgi:leader peptidase (prepilin peptidase)/N-methyltransferase